VIDLDPDSLRSYGVSPYNVVQAVLHSNLTLPSVDPFDRESIHFEQP